ncbi:PorZ beta-propeller-like domain-containing protein [Dyadobacter luticola]|uniref:T9SS type A sorting domain-containing protein n=1 Tax=Dyadobacter luticola TaxID=1979387 RepID=A0A5R9KWV4_9BACT|nr:T9SS type A sorting domain-containing protein [Dyadobacter luticola]TLV00734.1 T9SS type A sorting domain-containing protein [Dyadobacter luticola]
MKQDFFKENSSRPRQQARLLLFFLTLSFHFVSGQNSPIGSWETHFNYRLARQVIKVKNHIFCGSYNGLSSVDANNQIKTWSKIDGLHETGISSLAYDEAQNTLILAYRNGNLDFVTLDDEAKPTQIDPWRLLNETQGIPEDKSVRHIILKDQSAYLCTSFGIVILDLGQKQVKETYRYIGQDGTQVSVKQAAFSADSLFALTSQGLLAVSTSPTVNRQYFANWKAISAPGQIVSVGTFGKDIYAGIAGSGLFKREKAAWKLVYTSKSQHYNIRESQDHLVVALDNEFVTIDKTGTIQHLADPKFRMLNDAILTDERTYWAADGHNGLLTDSGTGFQSVNPAQSDTTISPRLDSVIIDLDGLSWSRLPGYLGGGILVKNTQTQQQRVLSTNVGSGSLPSQNINSLALDNDGFVWFASDKGVGYIAPQDILGGGRVDAILPVYGERKLFATEKCTAIAVEPGNRKWIGTRNGIFLFNADGTELVEKFTAADTPLPSDQINALRFDATTGRLFVDTPNGMVSYQSNASEPAENLESVTIFPNPVRPNFSGQIGFKGLVQSSTVKITTLSGRLVYQTTSQGGTASWNLDDYTGRRARGGIYMVFIVSESGSEKLAGKLAVIE